MKRREFFRLGAAGVAGATLSSFGLTGCDSFLDPEVHSQLAPENYLNTEAGLVSTLGAAYSASEFIASYWMNNISGWTTDIAWETGGGLNRVAVPIINFTWSTSAYSRSYTGNYDAIRNANIVLENAGRPDISSEQEAMLRAEARFVRAFSYVNQYLLFGPVPLRTSTEQEQELPRATDEEMRSFIEQELLEVIPNLPAPGEQPAYGRATNGAARGRLAKFYLHTKQWQKAADMAQEVIDMNAYGLYPDHLDMFKVQNEGNEEMVWAFTARPENPATGNNWMNGAFPPRFQSHPRTGLEWQDNWANWAAQWRLRDRFVNSFEEGDERMRAIIREYVNMDGEMVNLEADVDNCRSFKFWPDPAAVGRHGNDIPVIRYADILLSRAEALNELQGPNQESIDLINEVRSRAEVADIALSSFGSKQSLRDHLVMERAWEFHSEGHRRKDLIRMGKFIEGTVSLQRTGKIEIGAQSRGIESAQEYHRLFPIPQSAIDSNPALEQNPGY